MLELKFNHVSKRCPCSNINITIDIIVTLVANKIHSASAASQIPQNLGLTSIRHRSDTFVSDRCLIDVYPTAVAVLDVGTVSCGAGYQREQCGTQSILDYKLLQLPVSSNMKRDNSKWRMICISCGIHGLMYKPLLHVDTYMSVLSIGKTENTIPLKIPLV